MSSGFRNKPQRFWEPLPNDDFDNHFASIGACLLLVTVLFFIVGCAFNCQEKRTMTKINAWRVTQGLDTLDGMK